MRKIVFIFLLACSPVITIAQYNWDFGAHLGISNYLGEMGGNEKTRRNFISDIKLNETCMAGGAFARYKFSPLISAKLALNSIQIDGADHYSTNPGRVGRNLSFHNNIAELELTGEIYFYTEPDLGHTYRYRNDFKMYALVGVAGFYSNPKTYYNGQWIALQPLQTEGKHYSRVGVAVPLGLGFFFTIQKRHRIGWEFDWRTTFTDYLDDVSGTYADPKDLSSPLAIELANRRDELPANRKGVPNADNYTPGSKRGDPSHKDSYLSTSVSYSYVLRGRSSFYRSKYGSIFKHKKYKKRKVRAKF